MTRIGEENIATNGMKMKIIAYRNSKDLDVQFENGHIIYNKGYKEFKKGYIRENLQKTRVGEENIAHNGLKMKIIKYVNSRNIDVQFENGYIAKKRLYCEFKSGYISIPDFYRNNHIGEIVKATNGLIMEVIEYKNSENVTVKFEDGIIVENQVYDSFKSGKIRHPYFKISTKLCSDNYFGCKIEYAFEYGKEKYYKVFDDKNETNFIATLKEIYEKRL